MTTDRQRQIAKKSALPAYLRDLSEIMGREVTLNELQELPVKNKSKNKAEIERKIEFQLDKLDFKHISRLFSQLSLLNSEPVLIWLARTRDCQTILEVEILDIQFEKLLKLLPEQSIALTTRDQKDRLLLDVFDDDGLSFLEISLSGESWGKVAEFEVFS